MDIGFSPEVKCALKAAEDEARRQYIPYVSTEHLLLGLLSPETNTPPNAAVCVLRALGVAPEPLQKRLREYGGGRGDRYDLTKPVELTGNGKIALALAAVEATQAHAPSIAVEHLLIGLIRLKRGLAARVLAEQGVDVEGCHEVLRRRKTLGSDAEGPTARE